MTFAIIVFFTTPVFAWGMFVLARDRSVFGLTVMWALVMIANVLFFGYGTNPAANLVFLKLWAVFFVLPNMIFAGVSVIGWTQAGTERA